MRPVSRHCAGETLGDGVHAWRPDVAEHRPDPGIGEDGVEMRRKFELRSRIMNLTRCACSPRSISRFRACLEVHSTVVRL